MTLFPEAPRGSAHFSECRRYRYLMTREFGGTGPAVSIGLVNPSTADGSEDDPTTRKMIGFCRRLGASRLIVILDALLQSQLRIVAWGPLTKLPRPLRGRWREVCAIADSIGAELQCWGVAKDGHPLHPLMLPYDLPLRPWERPE